MLRFMFINLYHIASSRHVVHIIRATHVIMMLSDVREFTGGY